MNEDISKMSLVQISGGWVLDWWLAELSQPRDKVHSVAFVPDEFPEWDPIKRAAWVDAFFQFQDATSEYPLPSLAIRDEWKTKALAAKVANKE